jgi:hypothetical protein
VLDILDDVADTKERVALASICDKRFSEDPLGPLSLAWLRGLFRLDPEAATHAFEVSLAALPEEQRSDRAISMLTSLFGDRGIVLLFGDDERRAISLGRLVCCTYRYVRPAEDQVHEGPYSPDSRDNAERARNFLLGALLDTPGAKSQEVLRSLAADPVFAGFPDRLRLLARKRAASDTESAALRPEEIATFDERLEAPPRDRDALFSVMIDRLEDLSHDIAHDDFTDRRTLQKIHDESEMQRTLARRLRDAAKGAYVVSREDEVADLNRTDIRLAAVRGEQKAVIEIKIADKRWSLAQLENALRDQLVGQYLRHKTCKAGCLLLTYDGTKEYWKLPNTGRRLSFPELVEHLKRSAEAIEQEFKHEVRLTVCPLDLTDPMSATSST